MTDIRTASPKDHPCEVHKHHAPEPLRTVHHHIWPQGLGGPSVSANMVWTDDTGHYNIHYWFDWLIDHKGTRFPNHGNREEKYLARLGYDRWKRGSL